MEEIKFKIQNYDGPLDLLLSLVKDKKMDVLEINLAELATEYLRIISELKVLNIDLASEYLVMASSLLQIKARALLTEPENEETKEVKEDILRQLIEYQQYKKVSKKLREKEIERNNFFSKSSEDYSQYEKEVDVTALDGNSSAIKLIIQMRKMFERVNANKLRETVVEKFNLSPAERRLEIVKLFKEKQDITFQDIFSVPTLNHFAVTMLTILDMSRTQEIILTQEDQFGDIKIKKGALNE